MSLTKVPYTNGVTVIGADNLNNIQDAIIALQNGGAISDDLKQALLQIAQKVAYIDDQGATYYQALYDALYPPKTAVSISAVFTQGSTVVYDNASLDSLKTMLVVTATYDDSSTEVLQSTAYTLSGTLTPGTSTVTVAYNSLTTTFTVTVTAAPTLSSISAVYTQSGTVYPDTSLDSLKSDLVVTATYSDSSTATVAAADYTLSGTLTAGTSTITVSYGGKTTTFNVTVSQAAENISTTPVSMRTVGSTASWDSQTLTGTVDSNGTSNWESIVLQGLKFKFSEISTKTIRVRYTVTVSGWTSNKSGSGAFCVLGLYTSNNPTANSSSARPYNTTPSGIVKKENGTFAIDVSIAASDAFTASGIDNYYLGVSFMCNATAGVTAVFSDFIFEVY